MVPPRRLRSRDATGRFLRNREDTLNLGNPEGSTFPCMDRATFDRVVDDTIETLPQWIVERVDNVQIVVEEWPTRQQDPSGHGLLGLYEGISLLERGVDYFATMPDTIYIFRQPHLQLGLSDAELRHEVRKTVLHELGHHLGIDDDRMHEIGYG